MKILIFSWRDIKHPWRGGAEVYLHEIAKKLVKYGHQVTYFAGAHPGGSLPEEEVDGVKIIRRGNRFTVYLWAFWYYLTNFRGKYDIILDQANGVPFFTPAYVTSTPVICLVHHIFKKQWFKEMYFPFNYIGYFLEKYLITFTYKHNQFVAVSESTKQDMVNYMDIKEENIDIVHNAIAPYFKKSCPKSQYPSIVYVGRLRKYKQIEILIRSLLRILYKYPNLKLHIIGTGDNYNALVELANRLGIAKSVIFHGFVSEKLKVDLLSSAWLLVNPSSHEGWGLTIMEAAACATTSVASNIPGFQDSVIDEQTGILAKNGDIYDLSCQINRVLSSPGLRYKLEKEALMRSRQYTWGKSARKYLKIFKKAMNKNRLVSNFKPLKSRQLRKNKLPLVSIITPTKNVAAFAGPCFESIKKQTYPNIEFIVVDNYSSDGTYQMAKKYTDKVFSHGPERNQQRNYAVNKAKGEYLMFVDSDMYMDPEMVADCVYRLERHKKSVAVILPELQVGKSIWSQARALEKEFNLGDETVESPRFFRTSAYKKSGGYDENLLYAEDMELTERIKKLGNITRSVFYIYHDEERLGYFDILGKKYFYGQSAKYYFSKQAGENTKGTSKKKAALGEKFSNFINNPVVSLTSIFLPAKGLSKKSTKTTKFIRPSYVKNWRKLLDRPFISLAFIFLRTTELTAMGFGYLFSLLKSESKQATSKNE